MPFNIGGRTNLLYCIFWGLLSVVWVKICYPTISGWIEKLPPLGAKIATWAVIVLMSCDAVISAGAMVRYVERQDSAAVQESSADTGNAAGTENTTGTVRAEKKSVIVFFPNIPRLSFAFATTSSISFLPATVALICINSALVVFAITLARVVLPVPGGP